MATARKFGNDGKDLGTVELPAALFDGEVNEHLIWEAVTIYLQNRRQGNAATKNRGLARKAMEKLLVRDPSMVAALVQKGGHPELQKMARGLLGSSGVLPKPKVKIMR